MGDANNVARSLAIGCAMAGAVFRIASPDGYSFSQSDLDRIRSAGLEPVAAPPLEAVKGADVVYTDVWTSMGQEAERRQRLRDFEGYTVDEVVLSEASDRAIFMHCLPAHPGEEVTRPVLDGPRSRVWPQAQNRMHAARGLLAFLLS